MRSVKQTKRILKDNSGETIVEVVVAFTLLSIMMLIFAQGLASASRSEMTATNNRNNADQSLIDLKQKIASDSPTSNSGNITVTNKGEIEIGSGDVIRYVYNVNGNNYVVYMPAED